ERCTIKFNPGVLAATNQFLEDATEAGHFREDLYYRLNVVPIHLPPLRERREDIPALARFFLERYSEENRCETPDLPVEVIKVLLAPDWPGNVRELEDCRERAVGLAHGQTLRAELLGTPGGRKGRRMGRPRSSDLPGLIQHLVRIAIQTNPSDDGKLYERVVGGVERELIEQVLQICDHVQVKAAARLGIN